MKWRLGRSVGMGLTLVLTAALAAAKTTISAVPGTLNYLEGTATIDGRTLQQQAVESTRLKKGQILDTDEGRAELLLTPGVFLRMGENSSLRMIAPGLANTQVELLQGTAMLEVDQLYKQNNLDVILDGSTTHITKRGLYEFNASQPAITVFEGQAKVFDHGRKAKVKGGHQLVLAEGKLKAREFDRSAAENEPLYRWSKLRSEYESEASTQMARTVYLYGGWNGPGWYWDPFWADYAFLGPGFFYGPFGYPFAGPGFGYGYGFGYPYGYPVIVGRAPGHIERGERSERGEHFERPPRRVPAPAPVHVFRSSGFRRGGSRPAGGLRPGGARR